MSSHFLLFFNQTSPQVENFKNNFLMILPIENEDVGSHPNKIFSQLNIKIKHNIENHVYFNEDVSVMFLGIGKLHQDVFQFVLIQDHVLFCVSMNLDFDTSTT